MGCCASAPEGRKHHLAAGSDSTDQVLWFPDDKLPCRKYMQGKTCSNAKCRYAHSDTGLVKLLRYLKSATKSIDIAVFTITCNEIADMLIASHQKGVRVRIVTDDEQGQSKGSDVRRLAQAGIAVVHDNSHYHMHHKFCIVDDALLLNGSLNWTVQGVTRNQENVVVSHNHVLIKEFSKHFNEMFARYKSNKVTAKGSMGTRAPHMKQFSQ